MLELIRNNLSTPLPLDSNSSLGGPLGAPPPNTPNASVQLFEATQRHFANIVEFINEMKSEARDSLSSGVVGIEGGFQRDYEGVWGDIVC